jgi:RNA polymerase sigma-70 factor (ECF subfamily)
MKAHISQKAPSGASDPSESPEQSLYDAIQANDPEWQGRAFATYFPLVRGLLRKSLGDDVEIEDLVDDVFLRLFERATNIRESRALGSYIVSITLNAARKEIRRRIRGRTLGWMCDDVNVLYEFPGVDNPEASAAMLRLSELLSELTQSERSAFVARGIDGMQIAEVAEALNTSISTAKRRVQGATTKLKKRLSRDILLSQYVARGATLGAVTA